METDIDTKPVRAGANGRRGWKRAAAAVAVLAVAGGAVALLRPRKAVTEEPLFTVMRGPLTISISEAGAIQSREKVIVRSQVEGRNTILFLIPEGGMVEKGDLLVELDASQFTDKKIEQQMRVDSASATLISSEEKLAVTRNQAQADTEKAELDLKFARLALEKYRAGEYPQALQKAEADITLAREELQRARDKLEWSQKLAQEGYITRSELQGDELSVKRTELSLQLAETGLELLRKYTYEEESERRKSASSQAEMALERTRRRASADVIQAEADLRARRSEFERQSNLLDKVELQIANCRITAPSNGMVVYATSGGGFRQNEPLAVGQQVIERQDLIYLPATAAMMAELKIPESSLTRVKENMPVRVTVDALPGQVFHGSLAKIAILPDATRAWLNPDLKVYSCEVHIANGSDRLRPGMNCKSEVIVAEYADAVYIPVQCVVRLGGRPHVYVQGARGAKPREVETGMDNNRMVHILRGLEPGEKVLLAPPLSEESGAAGPTNATAAASAPSPVPSPAEPQAAARPTDQASATSAPAAAAPDPGAPPRHGQGGTRRNRTEPQPAP